MDELDEDLLNDPKTDSLFIEEKPWQDQYKVGDRVMLLPDLHANLGIYDDLQIGSLGTVASRDPAGVYVKIDDGPKVLMFKREIGHANDIEWVAKVNAAMIEEVQNE